MTNERRAMLCMCITALLWSLSGLFTKLLPWHPLVISGARSFLAALVFVVYMRKANIRFLVNRRTLFIAVDSALIFAFYLPAIKLTSAANAIVLQYTAPIYVLIFSALFFKQKIKRADAVAVTLTIMGIALFFFDQFTGGQFLGNIFGLISGFFLAGMFLLTGRASTQERVNGLLMAQLITVLIAVPFLFTTAPVFTPINLFYALLFGIIQMGIPYLLYGVAVQHCTPLMCSLIATVEPLLNPVWVFLVVGETPSVYALIGGLIVLITITIWCIHNEHTKQKGLLTAAGLADYPPPAAN